MHFYSLLREVPICRRVGVVNPLEILSLDQAFDSTLDHRNVRFERVIELTDRLGNEFRVFECLALSGIIVSRGIN